MLIVVSMLSMPSMPSMPPEEVLVAVAAVIDKDMAMSIEVVAVLVAMLIAMVVELISILIDRSMLTNRM